MLRKRIFQICCPIPKSAALSHPKLSEGHITSGIGLMTIKLMILLVPLSSISNISLVVIGSRTDEIEMST